MKSETRFTLFIVSVLVGSIVIVFWSVSVFVELGGTLIDSYLDAKLASSEACAEVAGRDYEGCVDREMLLRLDEAR